MKKEYNLTISRKDRIYLVIFVMVLLAWELIKIVLPFPGSTEKIVIQSPAITIQDSISETGMEANRPGKNNFNKNEEEENKKEENKQNRVPVPIMTASVDQLVSIGFTKKVAYNIQKYISVGGQIRDENSLKKIYGMDTNAIADLIPYIIFPAPKEKRDSSFSTSPYPHKEYTPTIIDLNAASVDELESLPGIGAVLADRIIKFRTSLGGFTSPSQIKECYGLSPETFEMIKSRITLTQPALQFSINTIDPKTFSHPYLSKKIMWMLPSYIKNHGPIKDVETLRKVFPPDSSWCDKLLPYVKFE